MPWQECMKDAALSELRIHYQAAASELTYSNPFQLLVAVMLSAQSTDRQVNRVTADLFSKVSSPQELVCISVEGLESLIKGVGLYRTKARNLIKMSSLLCERHQGVVPQTFAELEALPGVGHKTASVVMSMAFGLPALAVDTHVYRVARRIGFANENSVTKVEQELKDVVPCAEWGAAHHWLIHHGRYCCKAQKPLCSSCVVAAYCRFLLSAKGSQEI